MIQERRHGAADAMPPLIHASHCVSDDIVLQLEISQQPSPPQVLLQTNLHSAAGSNSFGPAGDEPMASALLGPLLSLSYVRPLTASVNANCGLSSQFPVIHGAREAIAASFPQQVQTMETSTPVYGGATEEFSQPACLHSEDLENARAAADIEKGLQASAGPLIASPPANVRLLVVMRLFRKATSCLRTYMSRTRDTPPAAT